MHRIQTDKGFAVGVARRYHLCNKIRIMVIGNQSRIQIQIIITVIAINNKIRIFHNKMVTTNRRKNQKRLSAHGL